MAEIGKDGNNLFQSIFHRAPDVSSSADCLNINNEDASGDKNVNKHVGDEERQNCTNKEKENSCVSEETQSALKDTQLKHVDTFEPERQSASNGCSVPNDPLQSAVNVAVSEDDPKCDDLLVSENGISTDETLNEVLPDSSSASMSTLKAEGTKSGKSKRGIRFPSDTFISGYHEPPDPWKDGKS